MNFLGLFGTPKLSKKLLRIHNFILNQKHFYSIAAHKKLHADFVPNLMLQLQNYPINIQSEVGEYIINVIQPVRCVEDIVEEYAHPANITKFLQILSLVTEYEKVNKN